MLFFEDRPADERATFDTPWGLRELTNREAGDLHHQGLPVSAAEHETPETSLDDEREKLSKVTLTNVNSAAGAGTTVPGDPTAPLADDGTVPDSGSASTSNLTKPNPLLRS